MDGKRLTAWQRVQLARHPQRPYTLDYFEHMLEDFVELRGDRRFGDDRSIVGGLATIDGMPIMAIGQQKGRNTKENVERNFGMTRPEGFRKAMRLMKLAEKFNFPVLTFIDTPGASPDLQAEERGQAQAIAESLLTMAELRVPIIASIIGEGNSGGALAIGVADRLLMMEHAYFSVVSPEGCASILWRDASHAPEAAEAMRITAEELLAMGIIDSIVQEPAGAAHMDHKLAAERLKSAILRNLHELLDREEEELLENRYEKYRAIGQFVE